MDNTIFQNPNAVPQQPASSQPVAPVGIPAPTPMVSQPGNAMPPPPPMPPAAGGGLPMGLIIKGVIGFLVVLIVGFIAFLLLSNTFSKPKDEKVTLAFWGLWENKAVMQEVLAEFTRANPNITVEYTKQDIKQYRNRLQTRVQNGTGPDVLQFHNTWVPELSTVLLPIPSDVISSSEFSKLFYPVAKGDLIKSGALYGIPAEIDTLSLYINPEIFDPVGATVPTTWEEFTTTAKRLTVKDENGKIKTAGAALGTYDNITHAPDIISLLMVLNGVDMLDIGKDPKKASIALEFYTYFTKGEGNVWDETLDPSVLAFAKGNLAMYIGYSWDMLTMRAVNPDITFQVFPVPHVQDKSTAIASYWVNGVSQKSKHQKEAFLLLKYLAQKETEQKLFAAQAKSRGFGAPYARTDLAPLLKDNDQLYPFVAQAPIAVSTYFSSDTFDNGIDSEMNGYLGNAVRSILNNTSADSAVETLSQGVSQVLQKYGIK